MAVDATGLAQGAVSTFLARRMYHNTPQAKFAKSFVTRLDRGTEG